MRPGAITPNHSDTAAGSRHAPALAILLLGATACATALGATNSITDCDRTADLQSLQVPVSDLTAKIVGHVVVEPDNENDETLTALPTQGEPAAPILYLAPRVAAILQNVFSAVAIETPPSDFPVQDQPYVIESAPNDESPLSPVAGDATPSNSSELTDPATGIDEVDTGPSLQRQMFRTDI